jgi:hypothetical protein
MAVIQINTNPTRRQLNLFGVIWLVFFAAVGTVLRLKGHPPVVSTLLWSVAGVVPVIGWLVPAFMRLVYLGMSYLAWPIGFVVSHVILALVYYLIFTPIGLVMRLFGYDPMARRFDPEATTYWQRREPADGVAPARYFRQF